MRGKLRHVAVRGESHKLFYVSFNSIQWKRRVNKIKEHIFACCMELGEGRRETLLSTSKAPTKKAHEKNVYNFFHSWKKPNRGKKNVQQKWKQIFFPPLRSIKLHNYTLCLCRGSVCVGEWKSEWKMLGKKCSWGVATPPTKEKRIKKKKRKRARKKTPKACALCYRRIFKRHIRRRLGPL